MTEQDAYEQGRKDAAQAIRDHADRHFAKPRTDEQAAYRRHLLAAARIAEPLSPFLGLLVQGVSSGDLASVEHFTEDVERARSNVEAERTQ